MIASTTFKDAIAPLLQFLDRSVQVLADLIWEAHMRDATIYTCGNGGSAANASHFAQDLRARGIRAISLNDSIPAVTAIANDFGYEDVFSRQLDTLKDENPSDVLVCFSCSGKSRNVLRAVATAQHRGMGVVGITAYNGGELRNRADCSIHIDCQDMGTAEAMHSLVFHEAVKRWKHST